jgi:hypothetical protein
MSEKKATEIAAADPTVEDLPTPTITDSGTPSSHQSESELAERMKTLEDKLDSYARQSQSEKDKRLQKHENEIRDIRAVLDDFRKLKDGGMSDEVATMFLERLNTQPQQQSPRQPEKPVGDGLGRTAVADALAELSAHGLEANDADFNRILRGSYGSKAEFMSEVKSHIINRIKPRPDASPSGVVQGAATSTRKPGGEALTQEYTEKMLGARGKPAELRAIKEQYRNLGVDVDNVGFM